MEQDQSKTTLPSAAVSALYRGSKIEAIKLVREERGVDLKEAKDLVEISTNAAVYSSAFQRESGAV